MTPRRVRPCPQRCGAGASLHLQHLTWVVRAQGYMPCWSVCGTTSQSCFGEGAVGGNWLHLCPSKGAAPWCATSWGQQQVAGLSGPAMPTQALSTQRLAFIAAGSPKNVFVQVAWPRSSGASCCVVARARFIRDSPKPSLKPKSVLERTSVS